MNPSTDANQEPIPLPNTSRRGMLIPSDTLHWQFARSGGPGGQNVNKVATKAILRWNPRSAPFSPEVLQRLLLLSQRYLTAEGDILLTSQRHRTQRRNMEDCLEKLHQLIRAAWIRPKTRKPTKPTAGSRERRLQAKKHASQRRANRRIHRGE